jgi:hypothetical protein
LKEHERLYATHELELAAIVHTLKKWRHYLMERRFELRTNHNGLKYLFDQPILNARKRRWLDSYVSMTLILSASKENRTKWLMHSVGECMNCMLWPLACIIPTLKEDFLRLQNMICSTWSW